MLKTVHAYAWHLYCVINIIMFDIVHERYAHKNVTRGTREYSSNWVDMYII